MKAKIALILSIVASFLVLNACAADWCCHHPQPVISKDQAVEDYHAHRWHNN